MWIIETVNLRKQFKNILAVNGVSFKVKEGEIFGFLGPNGAGKTTVINMLNTLIKPTGGSANVAGYDIVKKENEVRASIGLVPQEVVLENYLTARENLEFYANLYHMPKEEAQNSIEKLLKLVDLTDRADDEVKTFSGGMKRRLEIAKSLLHNPKVLFMDEPTLGLDPQTRRHIWEYIKILNKKEKVSIFLTTHYLEEADFLCDRVAIINKGKIKALNTPSKLKENLMKGSIIDITVKSRYEKFLGYLKKSGYKPKIVENDKIRILVSDGKQIVPQLFKVAGKLKVDIHSIAMHEPSLEDVFIRYTGKSIREEAGNSGGKTMMRMFR